MRTMAPRRRLKVLLAIGGLACIGGFVAWQIKAAQNRDFTTAREMAGLAPYPASARDMRVYCNGHLFWTGYYVRFSASSGEIKAFLAASPSLKEKAPEIFSPKHQYLPLPAGQNASDLLDSPNAYFQDYGVVVKASAPWFNRTIKQAGRRYCIQYNDNNGEVVVDDVRHIVYVYVYDS